jgi:DNA primase large subunit
MYLVFMNSKKSISKVLEATLGFESPTPESQEKAAALISLIKSKSHNIDYDAFWREFVFSARQRFHIATVMLTVSMGKAFEDSLFGHLSSLPATEFDGIAEIFEEELKRKVVE